MNKKGEKVANMDDNAFEELISIGSALIDNVYSGLNASGVMRSPRRCHSRPSTSATSSRIRPTTRRSIELNSSLIHMEADLQRINRFCDNVALDLSAVAMPLPNSTSNSSRSAEIASPQAATACNLNATESNNDTVSSAVIPSTPPLTNVQRSEAVTVNAADHSPEIIDLSDYSFTIPYDDIYVTRTSRPPDVFVDLCTPPSTQRIGNERRAALNNANQSPRRAPRPSRDSAPKRFDAETKKEVKTSPEIKLTQNSQEESYKCPVCYENVRGRSPTSTKCGHVFCAICIRQALELTRKCPLCNKKLTARQIMRIYI